MEIKRDLYLRKLIKRMHNGMIKVITGIRRSGKSYLVFTIFKNYLKSQGVMDDHIIAIELDMYENEKYRDPDTILGYIKSRLTDEGDYYIFLDEVQLLSKFESVLNSFLRMSNVDVYVTGSNSKFLSKDVITEFRGRGEEVHVYDLINVLASGIGSLTNASKIEATFKSVIKSDISLNTIRAYIEYLKDAFIIDEVNRYDVKGRKYIGTPLKYYFEDVGLRNARLGFRQVEETHLMENIIYNELRVRGYQVDVGVVVKRSRTEKGVQEKKQLEIDFVANLGSKRYYIQSAFSLPDDEKRAQEKASLINVGDSFKKIVIVKDVVKPLHDDDGILTMSIYDFLLDENSLEL